MARKKPISLKMLEGAQPCRVKGVDAVSAPGLGEPPGWFGVAEREAWDLVKAELGSTGVLTQADRPMATLFAKVWSTWRKACETLDKEELIVETETTTKAHPCVAIANAASRQLERLLDKMGGTPASRVGLDVSKLPARNRLSAFMATKPKAGPDGKRRSS